MCTRVGGGRKDHMFIVATPFSDRCARQTSVVNRLVAHPPGLVRPCILLWQICGWFIVILLINGSSMSLFVMWLLLLGNFRYGSKTGGRNGGRPRGWRRSSERGRVKISARGIRILKKKKSRWDLLNRWSITENHFFWAIFVLYFVF